MGTTSLEMARRVVGILLEQPVTVALLDGFDRWDRGEPASDIDVAVSRSLASFGPKFFESLAVADCFAVVIWNYDIDASSVFVVDENVDEGVRVDLYYDDVGAGQYGLRARAVLARIDASTSPPRIDSVDAWLCSLRERLMQRQQLRAEALLADRPATDAALDARAAEIFEPRAAEGVRAAVETGRIPPRRLARALGDYPGLASRGMERLRHPAGFWVDLRGEPAVVERTATHVRERFAKVLPRVESLTSGPGAIPRGMAGRLKPELVISRGMRRPLAPVDLTLEVDTGPDATTQAIVRGMADRYL